MHAGEEITHNGIVKNPSESNVGSIEIALSSALCEASGQHQKWIHLLPAGKFQARDGRGPWQLGNTDSVIQASREYAGQNLIPIDYEHQTDKAENNGQPAPAAGWIKGLQARTDGLWGLAEWTERALDHIKHHEYRYLSPVFNFKPDGNVTRLLRAALTNVPALELTALAQARGTMLQNDENIAAMASKLGSLLSRLMQEKNVTTEQMAKAAGIDAGTVSQILRGDIERPPERRLRGFAQVLGVSLKTLTDALPKEAALSELKRMLDLGDDADFESIKACVGDLLIARQSTLPDPADYVPIGDFKKVVSELQEFKHSTGEATAKSAVEGAIQVGRLPPSLRDWGLSLCRANKPAFDEFIQAVGPVFEQLFSFQTKGLSPEERGAVAQTKPLTGEQEAICQALGHTKEELNRYTHR